MSRAYTRGGLKVLMMMMMREIWMLVKSLKMGKDIRRRRRRVGQGLILVGMNGGENGKGG